MLLQQYQCGKLFVYLEIFLIIQYITLGNCFIAFYARRALAVGIGFAQFEECGEQRQVGQQEDHGAESEQRPEQVFGGTGHEAVQHNHDGGNNTGDDEGAHGGFVDGVQLAEHGGEFTFVGSFGRGAVGADGPGDHVSQEAEQCADTEDKDNHAADTGGAQQRPQRIQNTAHQAEFIHGQGHQHTDGAQQVEDGDQQAGGDNGARDILAGVFHFITGTGHQFEAHEVIDDHRQEEQAGVPGGHESLEGKIVGHAVFSGEDESGHTDHDHDEGLEEGAQIGDPFADFQ